MSHRQSAIFSKVLNRGRPPEAFIDQLIAWGRTAPDEIFAINPNPADIYASVEPLLGPWMGLLHRRAVMLEVLRVLAGFESSWDWLEGRDVTNSTSNRPETEEAGAWQVSANSMYFGRDLKALVAARVKDHDHDGDIDADDFRAAKKLDHPFAIEYTARLLRHTVRHHGPVLRGEIHPWLSRAAVKKFMELLS